MVVLRPLAVSVWEALQMYSTHPHNMSFSYIISHLWTLVLLGHYWITSFYAHEELSGLKLEITVPGNRNQDQFWYQNCSSWTVCTFWSSYLVVPRCSFLEWLGNQSSAPSLSMFQKLLFLLWESRSKDQGCLMEDRQERKLNSCPKFCYQTDTPHNWIWFWLNRPTAALTTGCTNTS